MNKYLLTDGHVSTDLAHAKWRAIMEVATKCRITFFTASEQTSTSAQTNFGFTSGPVYMNGTTHRAFIMHQVHSGSYGFNKGSHQMGFRGWRVG